ncbi:MAG: D-glycerate dehydrogenase [Hyphomicrobiaceae bacterium]|nr:D-glycerate dehydrogenase [Hyphomicrobiaceae bacterium]MCC0024264.1 D-glycerate dehydrogenase [Hyphomicrobiaceae bacterium]
MTETPGRIFVTRRLPEPVQERMTQLFEVRFSNADLPLPVPDMISGAEGARVLVSTITDRLDEAVINALPGSVKLIAQFGNGIDNIDFGAASARGIIVTNTPSVMSEDTADMAMALLMAVPRRLTEGANLIVERGEWAGWAPTGMLGRRLGGKALGIVGLGRIGTAVARRAKAFGLTLHYFSRSRRPQPLEEELGAIYWDDLDAMLGAVDMVSLHLPLNQGTRLLLNEERLRKLRPGACVVNVSRKELVDERALVALIDEGHLSGAGLDVFTYDPQINPDLLRLARDNKVVLTPHMASSTIEGRIEMGEVVIVNIKLFLDGHQPPQRVLPV